MKFVTVFVLCAIFIASASAAPEPEATRAEPEPACQLKARSKSECRKLSRRKDACTTCVTSKCGACRTIYERWCRNPEPVADVETCLKQRADTAKARGKRSSVVRAFCRKALRKQCQEHACGGEPEPEPVPEPGACQLKARSKSECRKLSRKKDACSTCVTSKCGACRTIFERWCRNPEPVPDVETCLKARADTARARGKRDSVVRAFCRKALRKQCQEHSCAGGAPPKVPQPPKVTQEGPCIPRTKRALKIKGSGKQCKKAHKLKKQVKELKKKLNCLLVAFEGNIPKIKTEVLPPKPKIIRKVVKEVIPGEWVQKPAKIVEKVVTQIVQPTRRETARPRTTKKKAKVTKKPTPRPNNRKVVRRRRRPTPRPNTRKVVRRRRRPTPRPNNRKVRRRRRRRRRRRPNTRKVVRRRRRRPANNGRKVRRRRRRRRRRRPTNSRKVVRRRRRRRRRGGRAVRRRRRGGRAVRRRRRGGRAVRRRRVVVRRRRPAANTRVRRRPVRKAAPAPVRNSRV